MAPAYPTATENRYTDSSTLHSAATGLHELYQRNNKETSSFSFVFAPEMVPVWPKGLVHKLHLEDGLAITPAWRKNTNKIVFRKL